MEAAPTGIGVIHSHPLGAGVWPSGLDDDMDLYFADLFSSFGPGCPYVSVIVNRHRNGSLQFSGRAFLDGEWMAVSDWFTVGADRLSRIRSDLLDVRPEPAGGGTHESPVARLATLLGADAASRLQQSSVAILGCSGTGSPAAEIIARAGVGHCVLVDFQSFAPSNLERMHGSLRKHVEMPDPPLKVAILADHIRAINPAAKITAIAGNLLDEEVWDVLLGCDLVLGCTDTDHSRAAFGDLANHYLVPSLDVGVLMEGANGKLSAQIVEIVQYAPGLPCAFCDGRIDNQRLLHELLSDEELSRRREAAKAAARKGIEANQYWAGDPAQILTVGYLTTCAGSLIAGYAIGWLTGSSCLPASRFQLDFGSPGFGYVAAMRKIRPHCSCNSAFGHGDLARADRSVSRPAHWPPPVFLRLAS
jgi:hypothetical protein